MALPLALIGMAGQAVQGITGIASGIIGSGARKRAQRDAQAEYDRRISDYKNFDFQNLYADIENPMEDLRVATGAAEFQAQQQEQGLAQTLGALRSSGGGAGAAALAQVIAQGQARSQQQISANLQQQEVANERARAQMQAQLDLQAASGGMAVQEMELGRTETLLDISSQEKMAADQAREQATQAIFKGVGQLGGSIAQFGAIGGFKDGGLDKYRNAPNTNTLTGVEKVLGSGSFGSTVDPSVNIKNIERSSIFGGGVKKSYLNPDRFESMGLYQNTGTV